jgi:hypothetical protein
MNFSCRQRWHLLGCVCPNRKSCNEQTQNNPRLQPLSNPETGNFNSRTEARSTPALGRAESVPAMAYQCRGWDVSNHALCSDRGGGPAAQPNAMKKSSGNAHARKLNLPNWLDQATDCQENIVTLAELMQGYAETEGLNAGFIAHAGRMISCEAEKLHDLIQKLEHRSTER